MPKVDAEPETSSLIFVIAIIVVHVTTITAPIVIITLTVGYTTLGPYSTCKACSLSSTMSFGTKLVCPVCQQS